MVEVNYNAIDELPNEEELFNLYKTEALIYSSLLKNALRNDEFKEMFDVVIQLGAILAVVMIFWKQIFPFSFKEKPVIKKDIFSY